MSKRRWAGSAVRKARAEWESRLPAPCCRCGRPVVPDPARPHGGWQVDHWPVSREAGGTQLWPAHAHCNMSAGGKRGAQITNQRREKATMVRVHSHSRRIRGI